MRGNYPHAVATANAIVDAALARAEVGDRLDAYHADPNKPKHITMAWTSLMADYEDADEVLRVAVAVHREATKDLPLPPDPNRCAVCRHLHSPHCDASPSPARPKVVDLTAALEQSVAAAKDARNRRVAEPAPAVVVIDEQDPEHPYTEPA